jgi:hypothetical protein
MRTRVLPVLMLLLLPAVITAQGTAQPPAQSRGAVMSGMTLQPPKLTSPQPYVFRNPIPAKKRAHTHGKPTVVCGLTVVDADPTFDTAIRRPARRPGDMTKFTMRAIQPTVCARSER